MSKKSIWKIKVNMYIFQCCSFEYFYFMFAFVHAPGKTKNELLNRLSALGVSAHEGELFADDNQSPEEYANIAKEKQLDQDAASFESIEKIKNILVVSTSKAHSRHFFLKNAVVGFTHLRGYFRKGQVDRSVYRWGCNREFR